MKGKLQKNTKLSCIVRSIEMAVNSRPKSSPQEKLFQLVGYTTTAESVRVKSNNNLKSNSSGRIPRKSKSFWKK